MTVAGRPRSVPQGVGACRLGLFLCVLAASSCARTHLFYDARELRHQPLHGSNDRALTAELGGRVAGRSIVWVAADGREHVVTADEQGLRTLGLAERGALWLALNGGDNGGESDLRVRLAGRASVPVTVLIALDGSVRIISPPSRPARPDDAVLSEEGIRERFKLRGRLPGSWQETERRALTDALASLAPAELELVRRVVWDREGRSRDGDQSRAALYEMKGCRAVIYLYSSGVRADRFRFVGDPADPRSAVLHSIVHEIGHAFE